MLSRYRLCISYNGVEVFDEFLSFTDALDTVSEWISASHALDCIVDVTSLSYFIQEVEL